MSEPIESPPDYEGDDQEASSGSELSPEELAELDEEENDADSAQGE